MTNANKCDVCGKPKCGTPLPHHGHWSGSSDACHGHAAPAATGEAATGIGCKRYDIRGQLRATSNPWNDYEEFNLLPVENGKAYLAADVDRRWAENEDAHRLEIAALRFDLSRLRENFELAICNLNRKGPK